jgi:hypothetical protein
MSPRSLRLLFSKCLPRFSHPLLWESLALTFLAPTRDLLPGIGKIPTINGSYVFGGPAFAFKRSHPCVTRSWSISQPRRNNWLARIGSLSQSRPQRLQSGRGVFQLCSALLQRFQIYFENSLGLGFLVGIERGDSSDKDPVVDDAQVIIRQLFVCLCLCVPEQRDKSFSRNPRANLLSRTSWEVKWPNSHQQFRWQEGKHHPLVRQPGSFPLRFRS